MSAADDARSWFSGVRLPADASRVAGVAGAVGAAVAVGAALGVAAERVVVRRALRPDSEREEQFGSLRGRVVPVTATDGTQLHVEVDDPPPGSFAAKKNDGLTVVFCHGYALEEDMWHYQRRDLRALGKLVFWDQRSHGRSGRGPTENSTIDQLGLDLASVIAATCEPGDPIILVGHSMGGMTVMRIPISQRNSTGRFQACAVPHIDGRPTVAVLFCASTPELARDGAPIRAALGHHLERAQVGCPSTEGCKPCPRGCAGRLPSRSDPDRAVH